MFLSKRVLLCLLPVVVAVGVIVVPALAECTTYSNSRVAWIQGQSVCAFSGSGCTECWEDDGGCVTNGESCVPHLDIKH